MSATSRREFLKTSAAIGAGYWVAAGVQAAESRSPNERIAMASIGIGGKGTSDSNDAGTHGDMVAICDVDVNRLNQAGEKRFPKAKRYTDFRKMLEEMGKSIDAVTVSTADHTHAPASLMAMRMGKHCFCQKPMTRTIYEARLMGKVAAENKVATQMGNQGTATDGLRKAAALVQAGLLGKVSEVHVWTNRPIWAQGGNRPNPADPPESLDWDLWIGPAPMRPFAPGAYHPFAWRGWWDFGSGALGDMACHTMNMPFAALGLRDPESVQAKTSGHNHDSFPAWSIITYKFPATDKRGPVTMTWYDGGKRPDPELIGGKQPSGSGALLVGEKGKIYSPHDYGADFEVMGDLDVPEVEFTKSPGHFVEWVNAIKGGEPAMSNFPNYASPLTEMVLLGNLAVWAASEGEGPKVEWDAASMTAKGADRLAELVKPTYRGEYTLD